MSDSQSLKVVFAGTPMFAVPALHALADSRHQLSAVYTQPDRPSGRGRKLTASPVKVAAEALDYPIFQPATLTEPDVQSRLAELAADVMVVVAYGVILPPEVLATPRLGCLNIHASLLPRWRGAAPIQRAILAGDKQTGVTIMQMDRGLDTGDMLLTDAVPITNTLTSADLHDQLAERGAVALLRVLEQLGDGTAEARVQDHSASTYAEKINKSEARVDWNLSAIELNRRVRAFIPWPVAECIFDDQRLRIWSSEVLEQTAAEAPGTIVAASKAGVDVATGNGVLRLTSLQLPGGKPISAQQFVSAQDIAGRRLR